MAYREFHYHWQWQLKSSPEDLWPLVADSNRFDRDSGNPRTEDLNTPENELPNAKLRLRYWQFGIVPLEYEQEPFEWVYPEMFSVLRIFKSGPIGKAGATLRMEPLPDGGTLLRYHLWGQPGNPLGILAIPMMFGVLFRFSFDRSFKKYDQLIQSNQQKKQSLTRKPQLQPGARPRIQSFGQQLIEAGANATVVNHLLDFLENGDDLIISRMRPYELADYWQQARPEVLDVFLWATRLGLLSFRWDVLCPHCRVAKSTGASLAEISTTVYCESCHIQYDANFKNSVELTFRPNPTIRSANNKEYCIGAPQDTPHVLMQKMGGADQTIEFPINLMKGRYRLRGFDLPGGAYFRVVADGQKALTVPASPAGWAQNEIEIAQSATLKVHNQHARDHLFLLEHMAWSDQAVSGAEIIALQQFRDLFSAESLRPGEKFSVGNIAIAFTDLKSSTQLYRQIGDASAFGQVMQHFDILKAVVAEEGGAIVKTIGDSVMAVFLDPAKAVKAILRAQQVLRNPLDDRPPFILKGAIHYGPAIAVALNNQLDYFGSTINLAARLVEFSDGDDVVISQDVYNDPIVKETLASESFLTRKMGARVRGFTGEQFILWRVESL